MWYGVNSKICLSQHSGGVIQMYKLYRQSHWASKDSQKEKKKKKRVRNCFTKADKGRKPSPWPGPASYSARMSGPS